MASFDRLGKVEQWAKAAKLEWSECLVKFKSHTVEVLAPDQIKYVLILPQLEVCDCTLLRVDRCLPSFEVSTEEVRDTLLERHGELTTIWWD